MNETQKQLHDALRDLCQADPDLRMGQMIVNLVNYIDWKDCDQTIWQVEDEDLLRAARGLTETLRSRALSAA